MKINQKKTKSIIFNTSKLKDFTPRLTNMNNDIYENTETYKLLGVDFVTHHTKGLSWDMYIKNCIQRAYSNMWILRRLLELGVSIEDLLLTYTTRIRVHVEQNVPLWTFNISQKLSTQIEKIQKICLFLILGKQASNSYFCNLAILDLDTLENRRKTISKTFAEKTLKHPVHSNIFQRTSSANTRSGRRVVEPYGHTQRYNRSSVPSLARLLNEE